MNAKHYTGYFYSGIKNNKEYGPFSSTHLCLIEFESDGKHAVSVSSPVCGSIVVARQYRPFHALASSEAVMHFKGSIPGTDVGCEECRKKLAWCVLFDKAIEIENER